MDSPRAHLGSLVRKRRLSLDGMTVSAAARKAKIDRGTWIRLESGTSETEEYIYARAERVLGWPSGYCATILTGGSPALPGTEQPALDEADELDKKIEWFREEAERVESDRDLEADIRLELAGSLRRSYLLYRRLREAQDQTGHAGTETA